MGKKKIKSNLYWTTKNEIEFLDGIGTGRWSRVNGQGETEKRLKMLHGYLRSADARRWDRVDKNLAISHAVKLVAELAVGRNF